MGNHREPPARCNRPPFILECDEREKRNGPGHCKVCENMIPKADGTPHKGRSICSLECRIKVNLAWKHHNEIYTNYAESAYKRDGGICQGCKQHISYRDTEADHIKALCLLTDEERQDPHWWSMDNIQTLCHKCHVAKTREDMAKLRLLRRDKGELFAPEGEVING